MPRFIAIYGLIAGAVMIAGIIATMILNKGAPHSNLFLGYLIMLVGLSTIPVAVRQYRDQRLGGVIRFWPALGLGLAIVGVAGIAYALIWEAYLAVTGYDFMADYTASTLAAEKAKGISAEAYAKMAAELEAMRVQYANPLFRMPMTFVEILPVGVPIAILSAIAMRFPGFLPSKARTA